MHTIKYDVTLFEQGKDGVSRQHIICTNTVVLRVGKGGAQPGVLFKAVILLVNDYT